VERRGIAAFIIFLGFLFGIIPGLGLALGADSLDDFAPAAAFFLLGGVVTGFGIYIYVLLFRGLRRYPEFFPPEQGIPFELNGVKFALLTEKPTAMPGWCTDLFLLVENAYDAARVCVVNLEIVRRLPPVAVTGIQYPRRLPFVLAAGEFRIYRLPVLATVKAAPAIYWAEINLRVKAEDEGERSRPGLGRSVARLDASSVFLVQAFSLTCDYIPALALLRQTYGPWPKPDQAEEMAPPPLQDSPETSEAIASVSSTYQCLWLPDSFPEDSEIVSRTWAKIMDTIRWPDGFPGWIFN
jgi:hypothetical protein